MKASSAAVQEAPTWLAAQKGGIIMQAVKRPSGIVLPPRNSVVSASGGSLGTPSASVGTPKTSGRFAVYDLLENAPPRNFIEAAERGDDNYIIKAIERTLDFNINQTDRMGRSALHWAAESDHVDTVRTLLDFNIDYKAQDCMGRTAVHMAARAAGAEVMGVLLDGLPEEERTDIINAADKSGLTPVFLAFQRGEEGRPCFEYLMAHGARYNQQQLEEQAGAFASNEEGD